MNGIKIWLVTVIIIASIYIIHQFGSVFTIFFIALVAAYVLNPMVNFLQDHIKSLIFTDRKTKRGYRGFSVLIVLMLVFAILFLFFGFVKNLCIDQILNLLSDMPRMKIEVQRIIESVKDYFSTTVIPVSVLQPIEDFFNQLDGYISKLTVQLFSTVAGITAHALDIVLVIILLVYFMLDGEKIVEKLHRFMKLHNLNRISQLIIETHEMIWLYLKTRVIISGVMAMTVFMGLKIAEIKFAFLFAIMSFVFDFIPYFGSIAGCLIITLYALIVLGWAPAVKVFIFLLIVQQVEGNVIVPKIQGDKMQVHPLLILFALLLSNAIWGPVGMLFAVPLASVAKKIVLLVLAFLITPSCDVRKFLGSTEKVNIWEGNKKGNEDETNTDVLIDNLALGEEKNEDNDY